MLLLLFFLQVFVLLAEDEVLLRKKSVHIQKSVTEVGDFYIDRYEVSNQQFQAFARQNRLPLSPLQKAQAPDHLPAVGIDFFDASRYCETKNARLPTYAEFVRASQGDFVKRYPFGDDYPEGKAPFRTLEAIPSGPSEIDSFEEFASEDEIYHLSGNVAEWTADMVSELQPESRIVYGGSYISFGPEIRIGAYQKVPVSENSRPNIGFRCARSADLVSLGIIASEGQDRDSVLQNKLVQMQAVLQKEVRRDDEKKQVFLKIVLKEELEKRKALLLQKPKSPEGTSGILYGYFQRGAKKKLVWTDAYAIDTHSIRQALITSYYLKHGLETPYIHKKWLPKANMPGIATFETAKKLCLEAGKRLPTEREWDRSVYGLHASGKITEGPSGVSSVEGIHIETGIFKEWTADLYLPLESSHPSENQSGWLRLVKSPEYRAFSPANSLHHFRCVTSLPLQPSFEINEELNYFKPEFFKAMIDKIDAGENVFQIDWRTKEFEALMESREPKKMTTPVSTPKTALSSPPKLLAPPKILNLPKP